MNRKNESKVTLNSIGKRFTKIVPRILTEEWIIQITVGEKTTQTRQDLTDLSKWVMQRCLPFDRG